MGKKVKSILNFVAWITGVIVSLAVGFAMAGGTLSIPWLSSIGAGIVTMIAGWVVIISTLVSAALALLKQ
ncbi:hypothetical protein A3K74_00860 [Candidatus Pacearchaeota archaeon RBG_13_33_26]|nr:MAG: hypothetical protein A3K74_00860 [Candidatus Pacearchaeota archaeon RBG_13_33_26]